MLRKTAATGLLSGLALLLAACGGGAPPQDLTLSGVSPNSPSVVQGQSVTLTLTFTSQNGFQGQVSLSVTENGQPPSWLTFSPKSKSLNVPKGGQAQETLQLQVAGNAPTGPHALKLRATYGDKTAERDLTLTVNPPPSFALSLNPTSLSVQQGDSAQTALTLTPQNGFTGTVSLSLVAGQDGVPQGLSLSPQSVQVTGSSPVNQTLTLSASASTPTGIYRLRVRGTSGSLTQEAALTVTVSAPSGGGGGGGSGGSSGSAGGVQVSLQGGTFTQGPTAQNVPPPQGFQSPYGAIAFTAQVPQGGTLTVTLTFPSPIPQGAVLKKYQGNAWQDIPGAQLSGNTATYQVQDGGPLDGDGQANSQVVDPVALLVPAPTFTLSDPSPNPVSVTQGGTATFQVTLTSQNGFQGEVSLSLVDGQDPVPQGLSIASTNPSPISLSPNAQVQVTVTLSADAQVSPNTYRLTLRAQGGSVTQEKPLTVQVAPPVEVSPQVVEVQVSSSNRNYLQGTSTFQLVIRTSSGLSGTVSLHITNAEGQPLTGFSLNPSSVYVYQSQENRFSVSLSVYSGSLDRTNHQTTSGNWIPGDNPVYLRLAVGQTTKLVPLTVRVSAVPPGRIWSALPGGKLAADASGRAYVFWNRGLGYVDQFCPHVTVYAPNGKLLRSFDLEGHPCYRAWAIDIHVDTQGNIYTVTETYEGTSGIDGRYVMRLRKTLPEGQLLWEVVKDRVTNSSSGNLRLSRVWVADSGTVYLAYTDQVELPTIFGGTGLYPVGVVEAYSSEGTRLWRREFRATRVTSGNTSYYVDSYAQGGLAVGPDGVYVAGTTEGNLFRTLYGPSAPGDSVSTSGWVAKLDPNTGDVLWSDQFLGELPPPYTGDVTPVVLALDPSGSRLYLGGGTSMNFPPYSNQGSSDALLTLYNAQTGQREFLRLYGGSSHEALVAIGFTPDGSHVYLGIRNNLYKVPVSSPTLDLNDSLWSFYGGANSDIGIDDIRIVGEDLLYLDADNHLQRVLP
ncbi:choice-of-anchor U domain-containing protein [Thermus thermophilus]|uniref:Immunoglobulin domain-containing protein n=1 Tax=Thermus thermophilus TaxID=274 RepID=A0AAD1NXJ0_THETH|nr:choice-of-anchor U domain-containing protein [Thermus thermophilus]BBL81815.1 hypothetical protein TthAA220_05990 [Thermus thermophilus]BBL84117.1 hypothetical protein TthAA229_05980 [Thermus thermophilus]BCZ86421.1 hypothetical protein TthAA11_06030 [Thermus thermophilus]BCZ88817.1 hypothetical protein TthAA22_06220 [Thermus thermophilus]